MTSLMPIVKTVLDNLYNSIENADTNAKDAAIMSRLLALQDAYKNLCNPYSSPPDFSDPITRFAYIYKYTVAHADYIKQLIQQTPALASVFNNQNVVVASLGGGPGSDLIGILKYIARRGCRPTLVCDLFDKEELWADSWSRVAFEVDASCRFHVNFRQLDVTSPEARTRSTGYLNADIITLSYFLSEVWKYKNAAQSFFDHALSKTKSDALILYIDNSSSQFCDWFDDMANRAGLESISKDSRSFTSTVDEEKRDLEPYFSKFSATSSPKIKSDVAFRIMRKP
jgi:hypothetical protein